MDVLELLDRIEAVLRTARARDDADPAPSRPDPAEDALGTTLGSRAEVTEAFGALQRAATDTVDALDNGDYCSQTLGQSPSQCVALATGVRYRVVYSTWIFDEDAHLEATLDAITQGENARVSDYVPSRVLIRDRSEVLVIAKGYPDSEHLGFRSTHPAVVSYFCDLFDTVWERALPVTERRLDAVGVLTGEQVQMLRYLVLGRTDASIARSLGVSTRTVQRQIQAIQLHLNARGRFQLGLRVARLLPAINRDGAGPDDLSPGPALR